MKKIIYLVLLFLAAQLITSDVLAAPTLSVVSEVSTPTNNNRPTFIFNATDMTGTGTAAWGGSCDTYFPEDINGVSAGNNTVMAGVAMPDGDYSDCTLIVTDGDGSSDALSMEAFVIDTGEPELSETAPIGYTVDTTPDYSFSTNEDGNITYGGGCNSSDSAAIAGVNVITFGSQTPLTSQTYTCTITVRDAAGNQTVLNVTPFTVDTEGGNSDGDFPAANDPFWEVLAQLDRPDDNSCVTKANIIFASYDIPTDGNRAQTTCDAIELILTSMESAMAAGDVATNLFVEDDWHHISGLYFDTDNGRIEFTAEIDFMSRSFMLFLQTLTERLDISREEIELDADIVSELRNAGAILTMRNVSNFDDVEIFVDDEEDDADVVSSLSYDRVNRIITFNVAHFTKFSAKEKGSSSSNRAKIKSIEARRFISDGGKDRIEIIIRGSKFDKKAKVKLGSREAVKVNWKSKYKLVAYFNVNSLKNVESPAYVKVINNHTASKKYEHKFDWRNLKLGQIIEK
ncbi:MAG: hypothetical protein WAV16_00645 [Candidatus Moraniibacteriota bacterium]